MNSTEFELSDIQAFLLEIEKLKLQQRRIRLPDVDLRNGCGTFMARNNIGGTSIINTASIPSANKRKFLAY